MKGKLPADFNFGILFGLIAGFTTAALLGSVFESFLDRKSWIYDYQTIFGSIIAIAGAGLTIRVMMHQVSQAEELHRDKLNRESNAARPLLSFVLVELSGYAESCAAILDRILGGEEQLPTKCIELPDDLPAMPKIPSEIFEGVRTNLINGNEDAVKALSKLLVLIQIQSSRLSQFLNKEHISNYAVAKEIRVYLIDAIELHARCMALFPYARGEDDFPSSVMTKGHLIQSAGLLFTLQSQSPLVMDLLEKYPD